MKPTNSGMNIVESLWQKVWEDLRKSWASWRCWPGYCLPAEVSPLHPSIPGDLLYWPDTGGCYHNKYYPGNNSLTLLYADCSPWSAASARIKRLILFSNSVTLSLAHSHRKLICYKRSPYTTLSTKRERLNSRKMKLKQDSYDIHSLQTCIALHKVFLS